MQNNKNFNWMRIMLYIFLVSTAVSYSVFFIISFELNRRPHEATLHRIHFLQDCLERYKNVNGTYPDKLSKLFDENASEQFQSICHDVWGNSFLYESDGKMWLLISQGKDGMIGGVGVDSDISIYSTTVRFNEKRKIPLKASPTFWQNFTLSAKYILINIFIGIVSLFSMILLLLDRDLLCRRKRSKTINETIGWRHILGGGLVALSLSLMLSVLANMGDY